MTLKVESKLCLVLSPPETLLNEFHMVVQWSELPPLSEKVTGLPPGLGLFSLFSRGFPPED